MSSQLSLFVYFFLISRRKVEIRQNEMTYMRVEDDCDVTNEDSEEFLNVIRLSTANCRISDGDDGAFVISTNTESYM